MADRQQAEFDTAVDGREEALAVFEINQLHEAVAVD
jgi:hypothetical protein